MRELLGAETVGMGGFGLELGYGIPNLELSLTVGLFDIEGCIACHAPHGSNHPGMLTKRAPLLCQSCHSQAGHPSVAYGTEGLASGMPSEYLLGQNCMNCHSQVHGSNHPSGSKLMR